MQHLEIFEQHNNSLQPISRRLWNGFWGRSCMDEAHTDYIFVCPLVCIAPCGNEALETEYNIRDG